LRSQVVAQESESLTERLKKRDSSVGKTGHGSLEEEARKVVSLKQTLAVVNAACQITGVDTNKGVGSAGVTTKADDAWVHSIVDNSINVGIDSVHGLRSWALVPVIWDTLVAGGVHEVAWLAGDGEERLENFGVERSTWNGLGVVRHEVHDEVVRVGSDEAGEWLGEVVWVVEEGVFGSVIGLRGDLVVG